MQTFPVFYCTDVNLHFIQPEVYFYTFWCERAFTLAKNRTNFFFFKSTLAHI